MSGGAAVALEAVTKRYGSEAVVAGVSLAIAKGHNPNQMNRNMQNRRRGWGRMV